MSRVVVVGGSFAGLTGALETKRKLGKNHEVILISKTDNFVYIPSLIWVPFGWRDVKDLTIPLKPILDKEGIRFVHAEVTKVDSENNTVSTSKGDYDYDYLLLGSGVDIRFDMVEGLGPDGHTYSVCTPGHAEHARKGWENFVKDPGPVVIGASQGASCVGAAYEFLFNFEYACRKAGIRKKVDITWITPEPFLAHFGIDGMKGGEALVKVFMKKFKINYVTSSEIEKITEDTVMLKNGKNLPFKYSMIIPPFNGAKFVKASGDLGDDKGFIPTHDTYQHKKYKNIFAAGLAVQLPAPWKTPVAMGVPKTGYPSDETAKVAAANIARLISGKGHLHSKPMGKIPGLCVLDAGRKEVIIVTNHLLKPRQFAMMLPNPFNDFTKLFLEKYFLWKTRTAKSYLL
ncbi:MAG: NAD(P)/FAD-dependent oxidoreductase [Candidatus Aquicultor sp.]